MYQVRIETRRRGYTLMVKMCNIYHQRRKHATTASTRTAYEYYSSRLPGIVLIVHELYTSTAVVPVNYFEY